MTAEGKDEYEVARLSFFKKRTATLSARLGPLVKLLRLVKQKGWETITERYAYEYMVEHAGVGQPATRASQLMQSINFLIHVCKATSLRNVVTECLSGFAAENCAEWAIGSKPGYFQQVSWKFWSAG